MDSETRDTSTETPVDVGEDARDQPGRLENTALGDGTAIPTTGYGFPDGAVVPESVLLWAKYRAAQAVADAALEISSDFSTEEGLYARRLDLAADAIYCEYADARFREIYCHAEMDEVEAENEREAGL
jgi:hypothetical protein